MDYILAPLHAHDLSKVIAPIVGGIKQTVSCVMELLPFVVALFIIIAVNYYVFLP